MEYLGNEEILALSKTAFLSSRRCSAAAVLRSYAWAKAQRSLGNCIVCSNHSQIERDVFDILLNGSQPLILLLPRGLKQCWSQPIQSALSVGRLLIMSPFSASVKRITRETAAIKNREIIKLSNKIVVGYKSEGGQLEQLLSEYEGELEVLV
ncbi:MAG: hypothetical protein JJT94_10635 [Bernardetiaceae bacterium]|nr:hypothetical protein [Bernardetiaceae bacterium]